MGMERVEYESVLLQELAEAHDRGELNITPWYQRRSVWNRPQKAYLINTLHERKPVPSVYIRHVIDLERERSVREVVDGQQRLRCILEYKSGAFPARHPNHKAPVAFGELTKQERIHFLQTSLSVGYLVGASDTDVIEIFARINSVSKTLNPQEKRNSQFSGAFKQFTLRESASRVQFWRDYGIFSDADIARMIEVQFMSDLCMNLLDGLQDYSATRLTNCYKRFDESFPKEDELENRLEQLFGLLSRVKAAALRGSTFARSEVLFSLIIAMHTRASLPHPDSIEQCIREIDSRIEAVRSGDNKDAMSTAEYEAFTTGNMHRIKSRTARNELIARLLR